MCMTFIAQWFRDFRQLGSRVSGRKSKVTTEFRIFPTDSNDVCRYMCPKRIFFFIQLKSFRKKFASTEHQKFKYRASLLEQRNSQENSFYLIIRKSCIKKFPGFTKFEVTGSMGWGKTFNSSVFCSQNTIRQLQTRECCISQLAPGKNYIWSTYCVNNRRPKCFWKYLSVLHVPQCFPAVVHLFSLSAHCLLLLPRYLRLFLGF